MVCFCAIGELDGLATIHTDRAVRAMALMGAPGESASDGASLFCAIGRVALPSRRSRAPRDPRRTDVATSGDGLTSLSVADHFKKRRFIATQHDVFGARRFALAATGTSKLCRVVTSTSRDFGPTVDISASGEGS
jgi:hypothetical protein